MMPVYSILDAGDNMMALAVPPELLLATVPCWTTVEPGAGMVAD